MRNSLFIIGLVCYLLVGCSAPQSQVKVLSTQPKVAVTGKGISVKVIEYQIEDEADFKLVEDSGIVFLSDESESALAFEGFVVRQLTFDEVNALSTSLGKPSKHSEVYHGQIVDWRDIHQRKILTSGMVISYEGVPHIINNGYLTLLARGFEVERENGAFTYIHIVPTWHVPRTASAFIGDGNAPKQSKVFDSLEIESLLGDQEAIVIAVELKPATPTTGPVDDGQVPLNLAEALMGSPVDSHVIVMVVIESHLQIQ